MWVPLPVFSSGKMEHPRAKFTPISVHIVFFFSSVSITSCSTSHLPSLSRMAVVLWLLLSLCVLCLLKETWKWYVDISQAGLPPGDRGFPFFYNFFDVWSNKVLISFLSSYLLLFSSPFLSTSFFFSSFFPFLFFSIVCTTTLSSTSNVTALEW
jgi:hypothetical protein